MKGHKNKTNTSAYIILILVFLCAAVFCISVFLKKEPETDFTPAADETVSEVQTWEEPVKTKEPEKTLTEEEAPVQTSGTPEDTILEITESTTLDGYTADLTVLPDEKPDLKPPAPPVTKDDTTNPDVKPEYDDSVVTKEDTADPHHGQVYDPVFGWVTPSGVKQDTIDSTGDINKQIGTMGGN